MRNIEIALPKQARSLKEKEVVDARKSMLDEPHIRPLTEYIKKLEKKYPDLEFPYFDPLDGGCNADILFLLEKPGPKTSEKGQGSGFISRDNNDPTAEAIFNFMAIAKIPRKRTVIWNVIPGWNGTRKVTSHELKQGVLELGIIFSLLSQLKTVVLVGRKAEEAKKFLKLESIIISAHPSPINRASRPKLWGEIPEVWKKAIVN